MIAAASAWLALAPAALLAAASPLPGDPDVVASARLEVLPDTLGAPRARVAFGLRLGVELAPRWRLDVVGAARLSGSFGFPRAAEVSRVVVTYEGPAARVTLGRLADPRGGGLLLDGVVLAWGARDARVTGRVWLGHAWHPELGLVEYPAVATGVEVSLDPLDPGGARATTVTLGGGLRGADGSPEGRLWVRADRRDARGGRLDAGLEGGFARAGVLPTVPLRAHVGAAGPVGPLDLGGEVRWEGLPRVGVPLGAPTALELLAPEGYGVARGRVAARLGAARLGLEGGPTWTPGAGGVQGGGIGRLSATAPAGPGRWGASAVLAAFGRSVVGGGGASGSLRAGPFQGGVEATVLRFSGIDHAAGWVGEVRGRAGVLLPPPRERMPAVRIEGRVAGGADRLLAAWVRGGFRVEVLAGRAALGGRP